MELCLRALMVAQLAENCLHGVSPKFCDRVGEKMTLDLTVSQFTPVHTATIHFLDTRFNFMFSPCIFKSVTFICRLMLLIV